ncbi:hypothetical protein J6TS2_34730 [Heyndrickxia sporothermodurans]|nr:hypothetical protein J6TS2_34730 [Heyndrickxia sporothermodurans]
MEETIVIANELGIKHPTNPKTGEPIVMTTDFLLTINKDQGVIEVARTIKMKDELLKESVLKKIKIEREYWQRKNIDWGIVTEEEISKTIVDLKERCTVLSLWILLSKGVFLSKEEKTF